MRKVRTTLAFVAMIMAASCSIKSMDVEITPDGDCDITDLTVNLEMEDLAIDETKAYLNLGESSWNYAWEDGDQIGYFRFRGRNRYEGMAEVEKTPSSVTVNYSAKENGFKAGDAIFSYLYMTDTDDALGEIGLNNGDPYNFYVSIPTLQCSDFTPEEYDYTEDYSFSVDNPKVKTASGQSSYTINGTKSPEGVQPKDVVLKFHIKGYNPACTYCTSDNASGLTIDYYGNASCTVTFDVLSEYDQEGILLWKETSATVVENVDIYVSGYPEKKAVIPIQVSANGKGNLIGSYDTRKLTIEYKVVIDSITDASIILGYTEFGDNKMYPVRDCMPCVSKQLTLSKDNINYSETIATSMTMYMLGSVVEFRVNTLDQAIAGEKLQMVFFTTNEDACAGIAQYDLIGGSLEMGAMTENTIVSVIDDEDALPEVPYGSDSYTSLYMVLAPGTYSATVSFVTDKNVYTFEMPEKVFSRAKKKALLYNLASPTCSVCTIEEFFAEPGDEGGDEGTEEGGDDEEPESGETVEPQIPVMGSITTNNVSVQEVSGLCLAKEKDGLMVVGDAGTLTKFAFSDFSTTSYLTTTNTGSADLEDVTINPSTGDLYFAVERKQAVYTATYPTYSKSSFTSLFTVSEAVSGNYGNDGLEGISYYKDDKVFVGAQTNADLWLYTLSGEKLWGKSLKTTFGSNVISEIAGLCYDPVTDWLWVVDSELFKLYIMDVNATKIIATYDIKLANVENPEGICVDHANSCVWIADDSNTRKPKIHKLSFTNL